MDWTEIIISTKRPYAQAATDVATALCEGGIYVEDYADLEAQVKAIAHVDLIEESLVMQPRDEVRVHVYAPQNEGAAMCNALHSRLLAAGAVYTLAVQSVKDEDWENSWKQYYHPIEIGRRLAVAPSWEAYENSGRTVLRLDPGMAFGTGTHETTALCLAALDEVVQGGERVLDVGCGSGILGVAALLLGASSALGIDIDEMAVQTARENARLNNVNSHYAAEMGDLAQKASGVYDMICANIVADAILRLAPSVAQLLAPEGLFMASGIIDEREEEVADGLEKAGLFVCEVRRDKGWVALLAKHTKAGKP